MREKASRLSLRICDYLSRAEAKEIDPWMRDDLRIALITTLRAARGERNPHVSATYTVLGLHPDKVWPAIEARRRAQLGNLYDNFFGGASSPKKPVQSERDRRWTKRAA